MTNSKPAKHCVDFKNPDYLPVIQERIARLNLLRGNDKLLAAARVHYQHNPVDFIEDWMWTYDPRLPQPNLPFLLFPKQKEYIAWLEGKRADQKDGLVEKSRDMGITWLNMAYAIWGWLFLDGISISFGSRKEDLVDRIGDMDSIFEKGRYILNKLPTEFLPRFVDSKNGLERRYSEAKDATHMKIINRDNGSAITGESGDNIGRGGRSSIYFKDEAQPITARVLTPQGWRLMGSLRVGDVITGADGGKQTVTAINEVGRHETYTFGFSDGSRVQSTPNHIWAVDKVHGAKRRMNLRTKDIVERYKYESPRGQVQYLYRVPQQPVVRFSKQRKPLPLHPYLVGALLGDGYVKGLPKHQPKITTADPEIADWFDRLLPDGCKIVRTRRHEYALQDVRGRQGNKPQNKSRAKAAVIASGIAGHGAETKSIPERYLKSSPANRLALLQGLMDTDGSASSSMTTFHSSSEQLANDVVFLVQSLGGVASKRTTSDQRESRYLDMMIVNIRLPDGVLPFRLSRKIEQMKRRSNAVCRTITSVNKDTFQSETRCITVSNSDGLYITDGMVITHNSAFYDRPQRIDAALSQNSNVKIDCSTPNGSGNPFHQKRVGGKIDVFTFNWRSDPRKDDAWYKHQVETLDPVIVAQEIDIDYSASVEGIAIPAKWVKAAIDFNLEKSGRIESALDVADGGGDSNVYSCRQGPVITRIVGWKEGDTTQTARRAMEHCREDGSRLLKYDVIGVGSGVKGETNSLQEAQPHSRIMVKPINVGSTKLPGYFEPGRKNADMFANQKAYLWWCLRRRFERTFQHREGIKQHDADDMISIPYHAELIAELSQPLRFFNEAGKIKIESKEAMKKRGISSPDYADSVVLLFAPASNGPDLSKLTSM